ARGRRGGALQRVGRVHPVVHHQLDLAGVVAVREDADVAAAEDRDAGVERRLEAGALAGDARGSGPSPFFHPAYCEVASPAASVGHSATLCSFISRNTSGVPASPCSIVSTPPSTARRIPSAVQCSA